MWTLFAVVSAWRVANAFGAGVAFGGSLVLFAIFQPVYNGDAEIVRWENRFAKSQHDWSVSATAETANADEAVLDDGIDLSTTTLSDFPRFLGSSDNATVDGIELAPWDNQKPEQVWKQPIGLGWSGFAIVNGYAVTQEQRIEKECVTCYEVATGKLIWNYSVDRRHEDSMGMGKAGPRATPTIDGGRVYAVSGTGILDCLDGGTGELIWSADVPTIVGITQNESTNSAGLEYTEEASTLAWGRSGSPLIYKDLVIVPGGKMPVDSPDAESEAKGATLIAFDKTTGDIVWKGGNRMIAYGSPMIRQVVGRDQILMTAEDHGVGHDPQTGVELWAFERDGQSNGGANCSEVTAISSDVLLFSKGYSAGGETVKVSHDDATDQWSVASIKKDPRILKTKLTSPVIYEGHLFSLSDGYLECVQIEGLQRKWKKRGRFGNGQLLLVGDKLIVHSEFGTLHLVAANPEKFVELGKIKTIDGICWNTLSLTGDLLLLRSDLEAACYRLPVAE